MKQSLSKTIRQKGSMFLSVFLCAAMLFSPFASLAKEADTAIRNNAEIEAEVRTLLAAGPYTEGRVIVIMRTEDIPEEGLLAESEEIMEAATEEYEFATGNLQSASTHVIDRIDDLSVLAVEQEGRSTKSILKQLLKNECVISAEPDYRIGSGEEPGGYLLGAGAAASPSIYWDELEKSAAALDANYESYDLTQYQWAMNREEGDKAFSLISTNAIKGDSDLNMEEWNDPEKKNASGTVIVMDTGVDYNHPDLKDVMADLSDYTDEIRSTYGIDSGRYGFNAADPDNPTDPGVVPYAEKTQIEGGHGTHVAGIIAADWNNGGISGVANGVRIVSVKFFDNTAYSGSLYTFLKAYAYIEALNKVAGEDLNIRAINCSFGGGFPSNAAKTAITRLGKQGIITVKSAGNDTSNIDISVNDSSTDANSPYCLMVGAANVGADPDSGYTNYGKLADLFAQGSDILAPIPAEITYSNGAYLPEVFQDSGSTVFYDSFKKDEFENDVLKTNKIIVYNGDFKRKQSAATFTINNVFEGDVSEATGSGALKLDLAQFISTDAAQKAKTEVILGMKLGSEAIDAADVETAGESFVIKKDAEGKVPSALTKYAALKEGLKYLGYRYGTGETDTLKLLTYPMMVKEGGSAMRSGDSVFAGTEVFDCAEGITCGHNTTTVNLDKMEEYADYKGLEYQWPISCEVVNTGDAENPVFEVCYYMYLKLILTDRETGEGKIKQSALYLDCIGAGKYLLPYAYWNGTSMAAPTASGMVAVQYTECESEQGFHELEPADRALVVIERLKANVMQHDSMKGYCETGGMLNAKPKADVLPLITGVTVPEGGDKIRLKGAGLGSFDRSKCKVKAEALIQGSAGDRTLQILKWDEENGEILCARPDGMESGVYSFWVTSATEKTTCYPALVKFSSDTQYEIEVELPRNAFAFEQINEDDINSSTMMCLMESLGGKLYLLPVDQINPIQLWEYDPKLGTGQNAFKRFTDPTLLQILDTDYDHLTSIGLASAGGKLWLYAKMLQEDGSEQVALVSLDPATGEYERRLKPEGMEAKEDMISMGAGSKYLAFYEISEKKGEPGEEGYRAGDSYRVYFYDTEKKLFTNETELTLPDKLVNKAGNYTVTADQNSLYMMGDFYDQEDNCVEKAWRLEVEFSQNAQGDPQAAVKYDRSMNMPKFSEDTDSAFSLTMYGSTPVAALANVTIGADKEADTFLYDPADGSYRRYARRASYGPTIALAAEVVGDTLYVMGMNAFEEKSLLFLKGTKLKEEHKGGGTEDNSSGRSGRKIWPNPAVTPIITNADGTQSMGSSIISMPPAKLSEKDRESLVETGRWTMQSSGYWQFITDKNELLTSRWALIPDALSSNKLGNYSWFYFDAAGHMATGWVWILGNDGKTYCYYFNEEDGSLYGACLLGGTVQGYPLNAEGRWVDAAGRAMTK